LWRFLRDKRIGDTYIHMEIGARRGIGKMHKRNHARVVALTRAVTFGGRP
jgi:hypothetical protein